MYEDLALWRHFNAAMNAAAAVTALSRCSMTDREPLYILAARQELQLIDELHSFAYNARRAIELAGDFEPGIIDHAKAMKLRGFAETHLPLQFDEEAQPLTDESLWWFLGRVIHSRELTIKRATDPQVGSKWADAPNITMYQTAIAFGVRSDHDAPNDSHLVKIDALLERFLGLKERFEVAIRNASA